METLLTKPDAAHNPPILSEWGEIRAGNLVVRLASNTREIEAAQLLRYHIFYEEMGGIPSADAKALKRDFDRFDPYCDHLLVMDNDLPAGSNKVVGTYRLLRRTAMRQLGRFYSEDEFDISAITHETGEILELGRSCVDIRYRNRAVMQLLWRGIAAYVFQHDVQMMFGCASLPGAQVAPHTLALSYLHHYHMAPPALRAVALPGEYVEMNLLARDAIDPKEAFATLPALIKGYLRVGSYIGNGAVVDPHCNTLDVCVVVKTDLITEKYIQRYSSNSSKTDE